MARVTREHGAATRLRHVADQNAGPVRDFRRLVGKPLEERNQLRMPPVAVAREPHHLPGLAVDRQRDAAGEAAMRVETDRTRSQVGGFYPPREQLFGGVLRIVRVGKRRQWL